MHHAILVREMFNGCLWTWSAIKVQKGKSVNDTEQRVRWSFSLQNRIGWQRGCYTWCRTSVPDKTAKYSTSVVIKPTTGGIEHTGVDEDRQSTCTGTLPVANVLPSIVRAMYMGQIRFPATLRKDGNSSRDGQWYREKERMEERK